MTQSHLPRDPLAAHEVLLQRAQQMFDQRREERRKPLPEHSQAEVCLTGSGAHQTIQAEVLDVSSSGMRLAAFAGASIGQGDHCEIAVLGQDNEARWSATVRWVEPHPLIQVFGVQFDL